MKCNVSLFFPSSVEEGIKGRLLLNKSFPHPSSFLPSSEGRRLKEFRNSKELRIKQ